MTYIPRISESMFDSSGPSSTDPWDPYPVYVRDVDLFSDGGQIKVDLLPASSGGASGVPPDVQTAINDAHDDVEAQAVHALEVALSAQSTAVTGVTLAQASADAAAADAAAAAVSAADAADSAASAIAAVTTEITTVVQEYIDTGSGLLDSDGNLAQDKAPDPFGAITTLYTDSPDARGGVYLYSISAAPSGSMIMPDPSAVKPMTVWTVKSIGSEDFTIATPSGVFDNDDTSILIHPGEAYTFTCDGASTYYILNQYVGEAP